MQHNALFAASNGRGPLWEFAAVVIVLAVLVLVVHRLGDPAPITAEAGAALLLSIHGAGK